MSDEIKFPQPRRFDHVVLELCFDRAEVKEWIKRCMIDRPIITPSYKNRWTRGMTGDEMMNAHPIHPRHENWVKWFKKWFSQFQSSARSVK